MRGRGKSRGRGGRSQNRGVFQSGGRGRMDRKQITHLQQFGEAHPSEELDDDFGPTSSKKFRGKETFQRNGKSGFAPAPAAEPSSESDSEPEAVTPFSELLDLARGSKSKKIEIVTSSEDEDDDEEDLVGEEEDLEDLDEKLGTLENEDSAALDEELDNKEGSKSEAEEEEIDEEQKVVTDLLESDDDADEDLEGDTVILEEELDPEAQDDFGSGGPCTDPFVLHFEQLLPEELVNKVKNGEKIYDVNVKKEFPVLDQHIFLGPSPIKAVERTLKPELGTTLEEYIRPTVTIPGPPIISKAITLENIPVKQQIKPRIGLVNQMVIDQELCKGPLTPMQTELLSLMCEYRDVCYPERTFKNAEAIRVAYCIHAANHVLKTRTRILHHNAKLSSKTDVPEQFRDQSFVRPKVLILVPFRESALRIVKYLTTLFLDTEKGNVVNKKRFVTEYGGETLFMPKTNPKPEDYMRTFAGNIDDNFRIGVSVTKKAMKLFTDFYSSDIIIASPLGLRVVIGAEGEQGRDYDFLASLEVVILDQADVINMQSWDHLLHIFRHLHLKPVTTHGTDFSRIRPWALEDLSKFYCQTIAFSSIQFPELNALFTRYCKNYAGLIKFVNPVVQGSIGHVTSQLPQIYQRFTTSSLAETHDARFQYFIKKVLPNFSGKLMTQTLIFIPSYFDFVRIRNYFKREELSFVQICEYTKDKKIARARDLFFHNKNHFMLYTERAMYFRRFRLKGIGHIIFYQLPQNPQLYAELCNLMQEDYQNRRTKARKNASVTTVYCQYDAPRLAAIVGSERAQHMLKSDKEAHAFVTGQL